MNKQQLASTIWQSANQMRSKIEANEYKDYILGFMFYKYLSDREISFLKGEKYSDEDIKKVTADDEKLVKHISENIGYFIAYEDLFSSWLSKGDDFDVSDVRDACLHALKDGNYEYKNYPELSYRAWIVSEQVNQEKAEVKGKKSSKAAFLRWFAPLIQALRA